MAAEGCKFVGVSSVGLMIEKKPGLPKLIEYNVHFGDPECQVEDRSSWFQGYRHLDVLSITPTSNGGTIELVYMQTYAPTALASTRDFWTLIYTICLEDGSLVDSMGAGQH